MLLLKYNDNYDLFDDGERTEFIFRIFKHVVLGGDPEQVGSEVIVDHLTQVFLARIIHFITLLPSQVCMLENLYISNA